MDVGDALPWSVKCVTAHAVMVSHWTGVLEPEWRVPAAVRDLELRCDQGTLIVTEGLWM